MKQDDKIEAPSSLPQPLNNKRKTSNHFYSIDVIE